jgi:MFS family permease
MSNPRHYLFLMGIYLAVVAVIGVMLYAPLKDAFMTNWAFNLLIFGVLIVGIGINMHQVMMLKPEINWIKVFRTGDIGISVVEPTRLLKPLAKNLEGLREDHFSLSAFSLRTVLEGINGRMEETREISRYMVGLLIFLGLLGTFWGLLGTISTVWKVIEGLEVGSKDFALLFQTLKSGLREPLGGMGTAFSSSLFGLGGSLVLGFLDLQAGHAQKRFFNELEEWLSGVTQLIDTKDEPEFGDFQEPSGLSGFRTRLDLLIGEMRKSNRAIEQLLEERKDRQK